MQKCQNCGGHLGDVLCVHNVCRNTHLANGTKCLNPDHRKEHASTVSCIRWLRIQAGLANGDSNPSLPSH